MEHVISTGLISDNYSNISTCENIANLLKTTLLEAKLVQGLIQDFLLGGGGNHIFEFFLDIFGQQNRRIQL